MPGCRSSAAGWLYNLENDIGETTDASEQNQDIFARLYTYLEKSLADLGNEVDCHPVRIVGNPQYLVPLKGSE